MSTPAPAVIASAASTVAIDANAASVRHDGRLDRSAMEIRHYRARTRPSVHGRVCLSLSSITPATLLSVAAGAACVQLGLPLASPGGVLAARIRRLP